MPLRRSKSSQHLLKQIMTLSEVKPHQSFNLYGPQTNKLRSELCKVRKMNILLDTNVVTHSNLGFCFFHNGTHLLNLNKKIFFQARTNTVEAERLIKHYPNLFIDPRKKRR